MKSFIKLLNPLSVAESLMMYAAPNSQTSTPLQNLSSNQAVRLIGSTFGVQVGSVGDWPIKPINTTAYSVLYCIVTNASVSLAQANGALYTAAAAGGTAIVSPAALSAATTNLKVVSMTIASTDVPSTPLTLTFRITTANTAAGTCDVYVYGYAFDSVLP
jgi:hypothetical protein